MPHRVPENFLQHGSLDICLGIVGCIFSASLYVGSLYVFSRGLPRDHVKTIRWRMLSSLLACSVAWLPLYLSILSKAPLHVRFVEVLGLVTTGSSATCAEGCNPVHELLVQMKQLATHVGVPVALTAVLFAGPLLHMMFTADISGWHHPQGLFKLRAACMRPSVVIGGLCSCARSCLDVLCAERHMRAWRNLVVAPVTEEFVFRACMLPLLLIQGATTTTVVFAAPVFFGVAHLHHLYELMHHKRLPAVQAIVMVAVQFAYTCVFGWYASFLFLRTGSLVAPIAAHCFCNWQGVPDFGDMARGSFGWRGVFVVTLVSIAAFSCLLGPWTNPTLYNGPHCVLAALGHA